MSGKRRMGPVDTIWLNMDRPDNLMVIDSLVLLESSPDWQRVVEALDTRLVARFPAFRQRPVPPRTPLGLPHWEDDPDFSLQHHVKRTRLPSPGDDRALQRYVDRHLHRPLDRQHPLWEVHLVDGYHDGAAVLWRVHHALADGIALMQVVLSLTDDAPGQPPEAAAPPSAPSGGLLGIVRRLTPGGAVDAGRLAVRTTMVVRDLLLISNPPSVFGGTPGERKKVVWSDPIPLVDLKAVGRLAGATLNDVLVSAVAGAMHRYQLDEGAEPVDLTTMVPVNVRPLDREPPPELGNRFALVFFTFPSATGPPLQRLAETKRRMDWLKSSPEAVLTFGLIAAIGRTAADLERYVVDFFANKAIGVTTNVAGPREVRYFAGTKVTGLLGWVPGSGRHTMGVCIITYAGAVRVGFRVDAQRVRHPQRLLEAFEIEVAELLGMARSIPHQRASAGGSTREGHHAD